jgi:proteasome assembly chaperone (PAC2) family protein
MSANENVVFAGKPTLRRPYLVCGISGWVDGGEAATGSVRYLTKKLSAKAFAEIPIGKFHLFQMPGQPSIRPHVRIEDGLLKEHRLPQNQFFYSINPSTAHDLILFLGTEPNLNWGEYADAILDVAQEFGTARVYRLGGILDNCPYTREPSVSCICSSLELKAEMQNYAVQFTSYEGPGTFGTTLHHVCQHRGLEMVSMTIRAAYYPEFDVFIPDNAVAIRGLVRRLNRLLGLNLDLSDLDSKVEDLKGKLAFMAKQNASFAAYIKQIEKDFVEVKYEEPLDISAKEAVEIAEELLKEEEGQI